MISRQQARQQIEQLIKQYEAISKAERPNLTEANVLHQFIDPLLQALGWPINDPARCKYELNTQVGRPDVVLLPESGGNVYVEAKRFGIIDKLAQSRNRLEGIVTPGQLSLPGMAADRTPEEQQAINYAFSNGGTWAILTNFERLRLFNARRDWLVLSFEEPSAFLDEFDQLWQLSYDSIRNGRLDQLSNQRHREDVDTDYLNFINTWRERLAQDILDKRNENWWVLDEDGRIQLPELRAVVQRVLDRLVVVRFAEDHLIVPPGTLLGMAEMRRTNPYSFSLTQFLQQLFRRFDEDHNSALFAAGLADQAVFSDNVLDGLIEKLYEARYRAMTADIMGNTYEQYLGKALVLRDDAIQTSDNLETRKKQGSYYTPQVIVRYLVDNSLGKILSGDGQAAPPKAAEIQNLRVIDPACGSGGFLIYAYELLANFYRGEMARLEAERQARYDELLAEGVTTPFDLQLQLTEYTQEMERLQQYPRFILENHLYGVDLDPQAAEIATVNLIMRAMADQRRGDKRLPLILNQNIKVGNGLVGAPPEDARLSDHEAALGELARLRREAVGGGKNHAALQQQIATLSQQVNDALNADLIEHFPDGDGALDDTVRPFNWAVEFPEVFANGGDPTALGFDVVLGNPPWEIVKPDLREYYAQFDPNIESKLTRKKAEARIAELDIGDPTLAEGWEAQKARIEAAATYYKKAPDYSRQGRGDTATHKLFLERGYDLLQDGGRLAFVIPSGIYSDLGTKELREMLLNEGKINALASITNGVAGGGVYFSDIHRSFKITMLIAEKGQPSEDFNAIFKIDPRDVPQPDKLLEFLAEDNQFMVLKTSSIMRFSPDSLSLMEFRNEQDYQIAEKIYDGKPLLGEKDVTWGVQFWREIDMTNDRRLFNQTESGLVLYEGKMIHQFDAYFSEPRFWIEEQKGRKRALRSQEDKGQEIDYQKCRIGYRDIARSTDQRTIIATILPPNVFAGNTVIVETETRDARMLYLVSVLNSFVLDFIIRYKIGTHVSMFYAYQLPVPRLTAGNPYFDAIVPRAARLSCTSPAFAPLWQAVMGTPWSPSLAATDSATRQQLRHELDALVARLYGLTRDEFAHILGTFPLVFPPTPEGEAKKATLLQIFDKTNL
ncbi:Eco57I restriction-modification methylase domain-containing protein [Candidatus Leptofilum sp.]|uniref:Eco57I restriction-modification methylase domain-containing protein n=1 Tax=Candidatus Leptofilum sp. TaxID=3241576 RepID=UPI003B5A5F7B